MEFCTNCGQPLDPVTRTCPVCSGNMGQAPVGNGFSPALKERIGSGLMLMLCILATVDTVLVFIRNSSITSTSFSFNFPILQIIVTIAFWLIYSAARTSSYGMNLGGLRFLSIAVTIARVLFWILFGVIVVLAVIFFAAPTIFDANMLGYIFYNTGLDILFEDFVPNLTYSFMAMILGGILVFIAVLILIFNISFMGSLSKSVKSVIASFEADGYRLERLGSVSGWLIFIACLYCLGVIYNIFAFENGQSVMPLASDVIEIVMCFLGAAYARKVRNIPLPYIPDTSQYRFY